MTPEEFRRASERFDETPSPTGERTPHEASDELVTASLVARHLETYEPVEVRAQFRMQTMRAIRRLRFRRDLFLVAKVAVATGFLITLAISAAFDFDLWRRLSATLDPSAITSAFGAAVRTLSTTISTATFALERSKPFWWFLPYPLLAAALCALLAQLALLRLGHRTVRLFSTRQL